MQKSRWIFQTLILSIALNATFLCTFFYFLICDNPLHFSYRPKEEVFIQSPPISHALLGKLHSFTFEFLIGLLNDSRKVEQGYKIRDFALGALATFHNFDVERALGRGELAKKKWEYKNQHFFLFPDIKDEDFDTLQDFARLERWPLTPKGLFFSIQKVGLENCDPALFNFFCSTPHFVLLETLFVRSQFLLQKQNVLALALESGWENLERFYVEQSQVCDFSANIRQEYLINAIKKGSKTAAYLLLILDLPFAKDLSDIQIARILDLLSIKTKESLQFAILIASSNRSDEIRQKAITRIADYIGNDPEEMSGRFYEKLGLKELRPNFRQHPPAAPDPSIHVIQPGESLWLIANKYKVAIEKIMEINHLESTTIQAGKSLKIPAH